MADAADKCLNGSSLAFPMKMHAVRMEAIKGVFSNFQTRNLQLKDIKLQEFIHVLGSSLHPVLGQWELAAATLADNSVRDAPSQGGSHFLAGCWEGERLLGVPCIALGGGHFGRLR